MPLREDRRWAYIKELERRAILCRFGDNERLHYHRAAAILAITAEEVNSTQQARNLRHIGKEIGEPLKSLSKGSTGSSSDSRSGSGGRPQGRGGAAGAVAYGLPPTGVFPSGAAALLTALLDFERCCAAADGATAANGGVDDVGGVPSQHPPSQLHTQHYHARSGSYLCPQRDELWARAKARYAPLGGVPGEGKTFCDPRDLDTRYSVQWAQTTYLATAGMLKEHQRKDMGGCVVRLTSKGRGVAKELDALGRAGLDAAVVVGAPLYSFHPPQRQCRSSGSGGSGHGSGGGGSVRGSSKQGAGMPSS